MNRRLWLQSTLAGLALAAGGRLRAAEAPVSVVVPYPAGGNADRIARLFAQGLGETLARTTVVENKGGAGGAIGARQVAQSAPDGRTLLLAPTAIMAITPYLREVGYDPVRDFTPVAKLSSSIGIVTARKDFPADDIAGLVAYGKQHPGAVTYGSAGLGTLTHMQAAALMKTLGIDALHVAYKGSGEALNDLLGGRIDLMVDSIALSQVQNGSAKALAVMPRNRSSTLPGVATLAEQGVALGIPSWFGIYAPAGTPAALVEELGAAAGRIMAAPEIDRRLASISMYASFQGPAEFTRQMQQDTEQCRALIAALDIPMQ